MSSDIKRRLRAVVCSPIHEEAAQAIEALEGEVTTLREDRDSHQRQCIAAIARAERLRAVLKPRLNAKAVEALQEILEAMEGLDEADAPYLKTLLDWHENARKALGGDAS